MFDIDKEIDDLLESAGIGTVTSPNDNIYLIENDTELDELAEELTRRDKATIAASAGGIAGGTLGALAGGVLGLVVGGGLGAIYGFAQGYLSFRENMDSFKKEINEAYVDGIITKREHDSILSNIQEYIKTGDNNILDDIKTDIERNKRLTALVKNAETEPVKINMQRFKK